MHKRWAESKRASIAIIAICQVGAMALWFSASAVDPVAGRGIPPVELHAGGADQRRAGGLRRRLHRQRRARSRRSLRSAAAHRAVGADRRDRKRAAARRRSVRRSLRRCCESSPASRWRACIRSGMKLASTWAQGDMGLMVGILVGALTLGSASPHLFNAFGGVQWRIPVAVASCSALRRGRPDRAGGHRPEPRADAALRSARRARRLARRAAAAREHRLPRAHVGAVCDVGVDRRLPARKLRA